VTACVKAVWTIGRCVVGETVLWVYELLRGSYSCFVKNLWPGKFRCCWCIFRETIYRNQWSSGGQCFWLRLRQHADRLLYELKFDYDHLQLYDRCTFERQMCIPWNTIRASWMRTCTLNPEFFITRIRILTMVLSHLGLGTVKYNGEWNSMSIMSLICWVMNAVIKIKRYRCMLLLLAF